MKALLWLLLLAAVVLGCEKYEQRRVLVFVDSTRVINNGAWNGFTTIIYTPKGPMTVPGIITAAPGCSTVFMLQERRP